MEKDTTLERRKQYRHHLRLGVCVKPLGVNDLYIESNIINMSLLGCAIEPADYSFQEKDKISICFVAAKENCSKTTSIGARVCHVCDDYIGLCFESMGADVMELLRNLLREEKYF
ncbi:MAG: PilZ domain-containing protein [Thiotrichaceae bacterium]|nr:PilZ domain-containing protein [Thiotrichaceae bacterium]